MTGIQQVRRAECSPAPRKGRNFMQPALPWFTATVVTALAAILLRRHSNAMYIAVGVALACLIYGIVQLNKRNN